MLQAAHELALLKLGLRIAECQVELARLDLAEGGPGASASARVRLAAAEAIAATRTLPLSLTRNLAAAKAELARRGGG